MTKPPRIALLMTGNELMSGDTVDSNSALIAQVLAESGHQVTEKSTVGDDIELLRLTLARLCRDHDVVIVNGGLGPTADDLTAEVVAELATAELFESPEARAHVENWCERRGIRANQSNLKQAYLPADSDLLPNPVGSAVGFSLLVYRALVITTPGVPSELRAMLPEVCTRVIARIGASSAHILRLQTFGMGESTIQQAVREQIPDWPWEVKLGFRAGMPQLEVKLAIEADHQLEALAFCRQRLEGVIGDHVIGEGDTTLAGELQRVLREQGKTITTAESCTGGLIASMITREPGSSAVFKTGFVTYANDSKQSLLGVDGATLAEHGAVSQPVVEQMLAGALARSGADIGVAVSGIAGPDGGSEDKPVGTVWIAWGSADDMHSHRVVITGSRQLFQTLVAAAGIDLMRRQLLGLPAMPHYFTRAAQ